MKTLISVDGLSIIRRVYEVAPDPKDAENIVKAASRSLTKAQSELNPTHSLLCIDYGGKTWRHLMYPEYKANRAPTPQLIRDIIPDIKRNAESAGYDVLMVEGVEADDVVGSSVTKWVALDESHEAIVVSTDKDLCALMANPRIKIYHYFEKLFRTEEWLLKKFNVTSDKLSEALALMGDTSDNIPGVHKVGPAGAGYILNKYGTLENAIKLGKKEEHKAVERLLDNVDIARLSSRLTALKLDIDIPLPYFTNKASNMSLF